jgi:rapamycin-insensitive companion of mTOR
VGSMELGAPFLESCEVVEEIVKIAETHPVLSMRGTAFFVLGLISRSSHGLEILSENGWDSNTTDMGNSLGLCIPTDVGRFYDTLKPWTHPPPSKIELPPTQLTVKTRPPVCVSDRAPLDDEVRPLPLDDEEKITARILEHVADVGNSVLYKRAYGELRKIKMARVRVFSSPDLYRRIMAMVEWGHYRLAARKLVRDLFEPGVLKAVVLGETAGKVEGDLARPRPINTRIGTPVREGKRRQDSESSDDDDDDDEDALISSSDEARTERQRSISDPSDLHPLPSPFMSPASLGGYVTSNLARQS